MGDSEQSSTVGSQIAMSSGDTTDWEDEREQEIDFVTLGMFIIDDIEYRPPKPPLTNIIGGAGTYSALGARLFSPAPTLSRSVGWIVDEGSDFPSSVKSTISSWETGVSFRYDPSRLTTRGWNGYVSSTEPDLRAFKYVTPKKRLTASDLAGTSLLQSKSFHLVCSPDRCRELVEEITRLRKKESAPGTYVRPLFIWEPVPDLCTPEELLNCTNTLPLVDVCSPNHGELAGFMGGDGLDPETGKINTAAVERSCEQLLASMPSQNYTLVIRAGEKGCYIARNGGRKRRPHGTKIATDSHKMEVDPGVETWIPAYHTDAAKVVDPTGGGNTFLGGLAVALARGKGIEEACAWGSVAAGLAIEQIGVPTLGKDEEGRETWNGVRVEERMKLFKERIGMDRKSGCKS